MKKVDLEKRLRECGWWLARQGNRHEVWTNGKVTEAVPRHREIDEYTARDPSQSRSTVGEAMKLEGRIWKSRTSRFWLAEVRDLDLVTQGRSRKDAAAMLADAVRSLVHHDDFRVDVKIGQRALCSVGSNDDVRLTALTLRRLRARNARSARSRAARRRAA